MARFWQVSDHAPDRPTQPTWNPMASRTLDPPRPARRSARRWLLEGEYEEVAGPYGHEREHHVHAWWKVMCLTGVDYFSTLGYQPGIAALAAGMLSPLATLVLILLTLLGALPIYRRVAGESPYGEGSIAMLERLLGWWQGKLFVLALLGFAATDFIVTITLSASDATAHLLENPFAPSFVDGHRVLVTLFLVSLLGAVFMRGFGEAIGIAVGLVATYLALNVVVLSVSLVHILRHPVLVSDWRHALIAERGDLPTMIAMSLVLFPKLALGLSGFETGVAVMPLVQGDDEANPLAGRIKNARKLLTTAALTMSVFLIASSFASTVLIPQPAFQAGGPANGRAIAYLAHKYLGNGFGTAYDISTILILWFAGASAMAGLLNIVPRYLPRYGMAPDWTRATRPLVLVFTTIAFAVIVIFRADVDAQGGAYATGVLVLMTSAAVAVTLSARAHRQTARIAGFGAIALVFAYTTGANIIERPDGVRIATLFIAAIVITSLVSRAFRSTELRAREVTFDDGALRFLEEAAHDDEIRVIANHPDARTPREYRAKEAQERAISHIPPGRVLFLEVRIRDASEFAPTLHVTGERIGAFRVLRVDGASIPNSIAAVLLAIRDVTGCRPHIYFGWSEGNPLKYLARFILFGEGDIAPVTHEVLRRAEPDPTRRPSIHVG